MFPAYSDIEAPLLRELIRRGGRSSPGDYDEQGRTVYAALADIFGLSPVEREQPTEDGEKRVHWEKMVRWARQKLWDRGFLISRRRGVWEITLEGRKSLRSQREAISRSDAPVCKAVLPQKIVDQCQMREGVTLFSWGYWGWGTATDRLIEAIDAVEKSRGYQPPMFVDIRLSRSVRAPGFNGGAFEKTVGAPRYQWLNALGNLAIRDGGRMRIKDPTAADTLLEIAKGCGRGRQRVLFFCSCEFPRVEGHGGCHRVTVARMVLEAAARQKLPVQIVEWPGGEPRPKGFEVQLSKAAFDKVRRGASSIPLQEPVSLAKMAAVPWLSLVVIRENGNDEQPPLRILTGPARYKKEGWYLPIYKNIPLDLPNEQISPRVRALRESTGFTLRHTLLRALPL